MYHFDCPTFITMLNIPHFYIIWKVLKNPLVGWLIVAVYKWIFNPASIFVGNFLQEFSQNSIPFSMTGWAWSNFQKNQDLLTIAFCLQSILKVYTQTFRWMIQMHPKVMLWVPECNSKCTLYHWDVATCTNQQFTGVWGEYFQQISGLIMGTNVAHILMNSCIKKTVQGTP